VECDSASSLITEVEAGRSSASDQGKGATEAARVWEENEFQSRNLRRESRQGRHDICWRKILRNLAAIDWHLFTDHQCQK
jgi:hypothetical protein